MIPDYDMLVRQAEKQVATVAALREIVERMLVIIETLAGAAQVSLLMAELSKPKDEGTPNDKP